MFTQSVRALAACLVLGCGACAAKTSAQAPPRPFVAVTPIGPDDNSHAPTISFQSGGHVWGGGWSGVDPAPGRYWPK